MTAERRPVIGVLCCNEVADRAVQVVASRFVEPLAHLSGATVLLVPAVPEAADVGGVSALLDGLLLTGSRSHVAPTRYGGAPAPGAHDEARDEVALALAARMIEAGKPVFGICRGLQEINVLFGGTLSNDAADRHHRGDWGGDFGDLFNHRHAVDLAAGGRLATALDRCRLDVNSVHQQGIERLGAGLAIEATAAEDGLIEAVAARPCGGDVIGVQWHPEWDVAHCAASRGFFHLIGRSLRASQATFQTSYRWPVAPAVSAQSVFAPSGPARHWTGH